MQNAALKNERIIWIDVAKGLGMILVVIGHSRPPEWLKEVIFSFHMPLFFFLSGLVYKAKSTSVSIKRRIMKDGKSLVIPYVITVFVIGVFLLVIQAQGRKGYYDSLLDLGRSALFGSGANYNEIKKIGEIWFLLAMFWSRRFMDGVYSFNSAYIRPVLVAIGVALSIVLASKRIWLATNIDIAFIALLFMYCGSLLQKEEELINNYFFLCLMIFVYYLAHHYSRLEMANRNYYHLWFLSLPGAIAMSIIVSKISMVLSKIKGVCSFLAYVGKHSLLFLCIHSLDWRMPFPKIGQSFINSFSSSSRYWIISSIHRFCFDFLVMVIILGALYICQQLPKRTQFDGKQR